MIKITEAMVEAAWQAFGDCPIDMCGDHDEEQKKCVVAAVEAALSAGQAQPVGYVTKNEFTNLRLGASCVDLFGKVVPTGFEMVPLYEHPPVQVPVVKAQPPVVTGQMEIEPDVTAADLGVNAEPESISEILNLALSVMNGCVHDGGFDREIGQIGCYLGDKCVCIGVYPLIAKAAAQQDYETRIRSALVPPAVPGEVEQVRKLCELHGQLLDRLQDATGIHVFYANQISDLADMVLDAATYIDRASRALSVPLPEIEGGDKGDGWQTVAIKPNHVNGGAYRKISVEEWRALGGDNNKFCDWHEGIGYVVYDDQAREQYRAKMEAAAPSASIEGETHDRP